jgi:uncharacterized ion transporter superfamily protein YfcC
MVGSAFSPVNPFQVGIAQKLAQVPLFSGSAFRIAFLIPALGIWIAGTMRHARMTRAAPGTDPARLPPDSTTAADDADFADEPATPALSGTRTTIILALVLVAFAAFITGLITLGWGFNELSAVFFVTGVVAGLAGGLGLNGTAHAFADGFREMAFAALLIGFARAIFVVLDDGRVIDTIVHGLFTPIGALPRTFAMTGMMGVHSVIHVLVPSVSGQAVLTMPVLVPLSDLLGVARQTTILAYQFGAGLCDIVTPTNGALMAILAAAGVRYDRWLRFAVPLWLMLLALGAVAIVVAIAIGLA